MKAAEPHLPRMVPLVTVSSTFTDLKSHRAALIKAIKDFGLAETAMENSSAKLIDVIESSLQMVRDGSAYVGIVSLRYGDPPQSQDRNPKGLSLTELEFNEAVRLNRPILLFVMGDKHRGRKEDFEHDTVKIKKLNDFRAHAKRMSADNRVNRVYAEFNSLGEFKEKIGPAIAELRRHLDGPQPMAPGAPGPARDKAIPQPPAFYAEPDYIVSNRFIGRTAQLQELDDWASPSDTYPVLLYDAIGGNGKSMLTWEWVTNHAGRSRPAWAGRFWYSFYEKGAVMADFCQRALAYMTGEPLESLRKRKTRELTRELMVELHARRWLIVLDGLERVLVAYHRIDAAEVPDEEANNPTDKIVDRDPFAAIRDEDDDLLRALASASPSKVLISSRLMPRALLNNANQAILGVRRIPLAGLRPPDAEALLKSFQIEGDSTAIQNYLSENCDCHPLVIGVLAGLIGDYLPDPGDFDAWAKDPNGGGSLNLGALNLTQRRNHILLAAIAALPAKNAELLGTLALLSESVDYETLAALNPHLSQERETAQDGQEAGAARNPQSELSRTVHDLQRRGLLQYDGQVRRYDLHPVVRAVTVSAMQMAEKERLGMRAVDHFSRQAHDPYENAKSLEDIGAALTIVRTLIRIGHWQQAYDVYSSDLSNALLFSLEAYVQALSLLRPFFPLGWDRAPSVIREDNAGTLLSNVGLALEGCHLGAVARQTHIAALRIHLKRKDWQRVATALLNFAHTLELSSQRNYKALLYALDVSLAAENKQLTFRVQLALFIYYASIGEWDEAERTWTTLDSMGREWSRFVYRSGDAEGLYAHYSFWRGTLQEADLLNVERLADHGNNRAQIRSLHGLRGEWRLQQGEWSLAAASLEEAVRLSREMGVFSPTAETKLVIAKFHLGQLADPRREAERLSRADFVSYADLAELWIAIGASDRAEVYARAAYRWAWGSGEPFVRRYDLNRAVALLMELGLPIPDLPVYDPSKEEKFPWEDEVRDAIEKLRAEKKPPPS